MALPLFGRHCFKQHMIARDSTVLPSPIASNIAVPVFCSNARFNAKVTPSCVKICKQPQEESAHATSQKYLLVRFQYGFETNFAKNLQVVAGDVSNELLLQHQI
jgi:hypothetical protein